MSGITVLVFAAMISFSGIPAAAYLDDYADNRYEPGGEFEKPDEN